MTGNAPPYPCYERLRDSSRYFSGMAAFSGERFKVAIDGVEEQMGGQYASGSYFDVLGTTATLRRVMKPEDDSVFGRGGPYGAVAVISYGLWERRFDRSPAVLGKSIQVGEAWATIVGVTPLGVQRPDARNARGRDHSDKPEQGYSIEGDVVVQCCWSPQTRRLAGSGSRRVGWILPSLSERDWG